MEGRLVVLDTAPPQPPHFLSKYPTTLMKKIRWLITEEPDERVYAVMLIKGNY